MKKMTDRERKHAEEWEVEKVTKESFFNKMKKEEFTDADAISAVDLIKVMAQFDNEMAHCMEKALWQRVLKALSSSNPIASTALETNEIDFCRWFA